MNRILKPGDTCENVCKDARSGVLIDARDYYLAVHSAIQRAERYVLIAGWQFDSEVPLVRGDDLAGVRGPVRLLELLKHATKTRPELEVYLLAWDYSLFLALEREWLQRMKFDWLTNDRIHFVFDDQHPAGASHHQKLVVVDETIAFAGGIDLCDARWDDPRHAVENPERVTIKGEPQKPYHDLAVYCMGPSVGDLKRLFFLRWQRATGTQLSLPPIAPGEPPSMPRALPIECPEVALSLTFGEHPASGSAKVEQILHLHEQAIASAKRLIYIETQYFTSTAIYDALCRRMREGDPGLEVVLVMPDGADTPKENFVLGDAQRWVLSSMCARAREHDHQVRVLYSAAPNAEGKPVPTFIHSKLLAVDDRLLTVGSANLTNRSMSLDSELNVVWECSADDDPLSRSIVRLRATLLSEHAGIPYEASFERQRGLCARIDELIGHSKLHRREISLHPEQIERTPLLERAFDPAAPLTDFELDELIEPRHD